MGIQIEWLAPETKVIHLTVEGQWTWDDFDGAMVIAHDMMDSTFCEHVDYIVDMRNGQTLPSNILSRMKSVSRNHHAKSRDMVVVDAGRFAEMMFTIMGRIMPQRMSHVILVQTLEEALEFLQNKHRGAVAAAIR